MNNLVEKIEYHLHLNIMGKVSDRLTLDYIELEVKNWNKSEVRKKYERSKELRRWEQKNT